MPGGYKWQPIADLPADPKTLMDGELESLHRVWLSQRKELVESGALDQFEKRLRREWAIETGIIERVYTLDRGVSRTLIAKGIDEAFIPHGASNRDSALVARIIRGHYDALEGMFDFIQGVGKISTGYIQQLHAALLRNQETYAVVDHFGRAFEKPLEKGRYKTEPNNPIRPDGLLHEYCPPEQVASEMDRLVSMHFEHAVRCVPVEVEAAWFHHRFTQIHPFADGNGRVARAIASLVFIKADWFPLVVNRDDWIHYVDMLEEADAGDLRPLVTMFVEAQRNALILASEAAFDIKPISSPEDAIAAVRDRLLQRAKLPVKDWPRAKETAGRLVAFTKMRFDEIAYALRAEISSLSPDFLFHATREQGIHESAAYDAVLRLRLQAGRADDLVVSFHGLAPRFRGMLGVTAGLTIEGTEPIVIESGFRINYEEDAATAQLRFSAWLERVIVEGLKQWSRTL